MKEGRRRNSMENYLSEEEHNALLELRTAILGINGQGGLINKVDRIEIGVFGDGSADNPGIKTTCALHTKAFRDHLKAHRSLKRSAITVAGIFGAGSGSILAYVIDHLHKIGWLR